MWRVLLASVLMASGSAAWAADLAPLRSELGRLGGELAAMRAVELVQLQESPTRTAALEVRLSRLEEQLRRLTGQIEEVEHAQRQMAARLDRLTAQPGEPATPAPSATAPTPLTPAPAPAPRQQAAAPAPSIEPDVAARKGYVLGTIPEEALRGQSAPKQPALPAPAPSGATQQARLQPQGADASYQAGLDLLQTGQWADAEQAFSGFVQTYPKDPRAPTASYWLGETYMLRKDYQGAAAAFARNYRTYGESAPRAADNLLKLGMALAAMGDRDRACQSFAELAKRHPNASAPIRQALSRERAAAGCS
jgi:tol-pal system protein YbgF